MAKLNEKIDNLSKKDIIMQQKFT